MLNDVVHLGFLIAKLRGQAARSALAGDTMDAQYFELRAQRWESELALLHEQDAHAARLRSERQDAYEQE